MCHGTDNAWEVNFNLSLPSFEPHILGLESLVDICRRTRAKIRFYFMSSISAALRSSHDTLGSRVPEAEISDLGAPMNGYGASKWVAEHLLASAAEFGVLNLSVFRVGQVGGPVETFGHGSMWSRKDWVPAVSGVLKEVHFYLLLIFHRLIHHLVKTKCIHQD